MLSYVIRKHWALSLPHDPKSVNCKIQNPPKQTRTILIFLKKQLWLNNNFEPYQWVHEICWQWTERKIASLEAELQFHVISANTKAWEYIMRLLSWLCTGTWMAINLPGRIFSWAKSGLMCQSDEEQEHQPQSEPLINSLLHSYCVGKHGRHSSHLSEYL